MRLLSVVSRRELGCVHCMGQGRVVVDRLRGVGVLIGMRGDCDRRRVSVTDWLSMCLVLKGGGLLWRVVYVLLLWLWLWLWL